MEKIHRPLIWLFCKLQLWTRLFYMRHTVITRIRWRRLEPKMMIYIFPIIIELFIYDISENRPCVIHHDVITSTCMPVSITTWHVWFWWWWVYTIDITMIASYPSTLFKRTTTFTSSFTFPLFSYYPFQASLSLLKILSKIKLIMFNCHQSIPC
jgi:hypothetical protein